MQVGKPLVGRTAPRS